MMHNRDVLLGYGVTASHFARLSISLEKQAELDRAFDLKRNCSMALITDVSEDLIPETIKNYFSGQIVMMNPHVQDIATGKSYFSLSKMRNATINYALENKFQWLMLCDCDTVLLGTDFNKLKSNFGVPWLYFQKTSQESIIDSVNIIKNSDSTIFSQGNSWFVLGIDILQNVRFNESFFGYGYEDLEFYLRVKNFGYDIEQCYFIIIHSYHIPEEKRVDPFRYEINRKLFEGSQKLIEAGQNIYRLTNTEIVHATHPNWSSDLLLMPPINRVMHVENKEFGDYTISNDLLTIRWDGWPAETFIRSNDGFVLTDKPVTQSLT